MSPRTVEIPVSLAKKIIDTTKDHGVLRGVAAALAGGDDQDGGPASARGGARKGSAGRAGGGSGRKAARRARKATLASRVRLAESAAAVLEHLPPPGEPIPSEELRKKLPDMSKSVYQRAVTYLVKQGRATQDGQRRQAKYARVATA